MAQSTSKSGDSKSQDATAKSSAAKSSGGKRAATKSSKSKANATKTLRVTQVGSAVGKLKRQQRNLVGLGLGKMNASREVVDTPATRGMINKVAHLVRVEDAG